MKWFQMNRSKMNVVSNVVVSNERGLKCRGLKWTWSQTKGLKWMWSQMNVVFDQFGLKWTWSQMKKSHVNVVSN